MIEMYELIQLKDSEAHGYIVPEIRFKNLNHDVYELNYNSKHWKP